MVRSIVWSGLALMALSGCASFESKSVAARPESPFGIHGPQYSHWLTEGKPHPWRAGDVHLTVLADTGAGWARQDFWWSLVEPTPGEFQWEDFDRAIESYQRHDVKLLVILCYGSAWGGGDAPTTDAERAAFANYVYQLVKRYGDVVAAWEVWNEPNILPFWAPRPDPVLYTKMLKEAYAAAKRADPDCVILGGAMAGPDVNFLRGMYEAGAADYFDVLSYHNYGQNNDLETEWPAVAEMRAVMAAHGDADKPVWHTENGFYTGPVGLSEALQARRLVRYSLGLLALRIERTFQLTVHDWTDDPEHADKSVYRGISTNDYGKKKSYYAYQTMCARINGKRFVRMLRPAPGVNGLLFEGGGETVLALWRIADGPETPLDIDLGTPLVLTQTLYGDWQRLANDSGRYQLELGPDPLYILNPGPSIAAQRHVAWPNPVESRVARSREAELTVTVTNPADAGSAQFTVHHPQQPSVQATAEIPARQTRTLRLTLDASRLTPGAHELAWTLTPPPSAAMPTLRGFRKVVIEPPLTLGFAPLTRLDPAQPEVTTVLRYSGSEPTPADIALDIGGRMVDQKTGVTLSPRSATEVPLALDVEALTGSDATLSVVVDAAGLRLETGTKKTLLKAPPAPTDVTIDGDLSEWQSRPPQVQPAQMTWEYVNADEPPPAEDLQVRAWVAYDERGLYVAVEVHDDHVVPTAGRTVWDWDSLQVALDLGVDGEPDEPFDENDVEIELGGGGSETWCYLGASPPGWPHEALTAQLRGVVRADAERGRMTYELLIPATIVANVAPLEPNTVIGFSFLVNDNDGAGRAGWQELTPGIGLGKRPAEFAWLWLTDGE